jgi:hypothetical protein
MSDDFIFEVSDCVNQIRHISTRNADKKRALHERYHYCWKLNFFNTFEEAKAFMVKRAEGKVQDAQAELTRATIALNKARHYIAPRSHTVKP